MTTQQDIQREIGKKYAEWSRQTFNLVKLPDDIINRFEEAVFLAPPNTHLLLINDIRGILNKKPEDLSILEVGHVVNIIMSVPPFQLYKDMDEYLTKGAVYSSLKNAYNKMVADKEEVLKAEANSKMRLVRQ